MFTHAFIYFEKACSVPVKKPKIYIFLSKPQNDSTSNKSDQTCQKDSYTYSYSEASCSFQITATISFTLPDTTVCLRQLPQARRIASEGTGVHSVKY